jgi:hypothetical protein
MLVQSSPYSSRFSSSNTNISATNQQNMMGIMRSPSSLLSSSSMNLRQQLQQQQQQQQQLHNDVLQEIIIY